jgi:hypothetical protein
LQKWIKDDREILEVRLKKSDYRPERIYLLGRFDQLYLLEKELEAFKQEKQ